MNQDKISAPALGVEFCYKFATPQEIQELHEQCIRAARWQLCTDGSAHLQQVYFDGSWTDYVPQVAKQMCYRFLNEYTLERRLKSVRLLAYFQEPEYQVEDTSLVLYLDESGDESGLAVILDESIRINPMDFGQLRFVLFIESQPR